MEIRVGKLFNAYNSMDCYVKNGKTRILSKMQMVEACDILEGRKPLSRLFALHTQLRICENEIFQCLSRTTFVG